MIRETKADYIERISLFMPRQMRPFFNELIISCDCGLNTLSADGKSGVQCRGWKVSTMIRAELPIGARTEKSIRAGKR